MEALASHSFYPDDWGVFTDLFFTAALEGARPLEIDLLRATAGLTM
jgi:hypothetical protein